MMARLVRAGFRPEVACALAREMVTLHEHLAITIGPRLGLIWESLIDNE